MRGCASRGGGWAQDIKKGVGMMEEKSFYARHKADIIVGIGLVLLLLVVYFSPSQISSRYRRVLIQFPVDGYVAAEDSQQFIATATITLLANEYQDEYEPDKQFIDGKIHLEIYNIGTEPLRDFRWVGEMDPDLREYFAWGRGGVLNDPGIYTRYSMLLTAARGPKHDMYPQDAVLPDYTYGGRRQPTRGFIYDGNLSLWYSETAGDLDAVLASAEKPIKLKLLHEGGTDYLLVYPVVDTSGMNKHE